MAAHEAEPLRHASAGPPPPPGKVVPLVVIGAGPHALALCSKLLEPSTDPLEECPANARLFKPAAAAAGPCAVQTRYSGDALPDALAKSQPRSAVRKKFRAATSRRRRAARRERLERGDLVVLDRNGEWFAQWDRQFRELAIPALRSGTTAHPCPVCSNSLDVCVLVRPSRSFLYPLPPVSLTRRRPTAGPTARGRASPGWCPWP